jgi:sRNA-binding regulator protein Hfq
MPQNSLRLIREQKGLTVAQLAGKTSISIRTLQAYEAGERAIAGDDLRKLSRLLFVTPAELLQTPPPSLHVTSPEPPAATKLSSTSPLSAPTMAPEPQPTPAPVFGEPRTFPESRPFGESRYSHDSPRFPMDTGRRPLGDVAPRPFGSPMPREPRPVRPERPFGQRPAGPRPTRERPAPRPPGPATAGQIDQIHNLARRLGMEEAQVLEQAGRPLESMDRMQARQVIAALRKNLEDSGTWQPRVGEGQDQEGAYLDKLQQRRVAIEVRLITGERLHGTVESYTPYIIRLRDASTGGDVAVRKLAIAYYRTEEPMDDAE